MVLSGPGVTEGRQQFRGTVSQCDQVISATAAAVATAKSRNLRQGTLNHGCGRIRHPISIILPTPTRPSFLQRDFYAPVQRSSVRRRVVRYGPRRSESLRHQPIHIIHALLLQPRDHRFRARFRKRLVMACVSLIVRVPSNNPAGSSMVVDQLEHSIQRR